MATGLSRLGRAGGAGVVPAAPGLKFSSHQAPAFSAGLGRAATKGNSCCQKKARMSRVGILPDPPRNKIQNTKYRVAQA